MSKRFGLGALLAVMAAICLANARSLWHPVYSAIVGRRTTEDVLRQLQAAVEPRLVELCAGTGLEFPPRRLALVGLKAERSLEVWGRDDGDWSLIATYPILGASGEAGPKLREGDRQVPEGVYPLEGLNPNSSYHLSLKIGYPSSFDREQAARDGRDDLGGDIFIHGKSVSIGCLAIGDEAIEELFFLVARVGFENVSVILAPHDLRVREEVVIPEDGEWLRELYAGLRDALIPFYVGD